MEELDEYSQLIYDNIDNAMIAFKDPEDEETLAKVLSLEESIDKMEKKLRKAPYQAPKEKRVQCESWYNIY